MSTINFEDKSYLACTVAQTSTLAPGKPIMFHHPSRLLFSVVKVFCLCILCQIGTSPAETPKSKAEETAPREWTVTESKQTQKKFEASLVDGEGGVVLLKKTDAKRSVLAVPLDMLSDADRAEVFRRLGIAVVDLSGVWRSDSGSYWNVSEGADGKVYVTLLSSPHLLSIEGVLLRRRQKLQSEQWICVFKDDPKHRTVSGTCEFNVVQDGRVRAKFDRWGFPKDEGIPRKMSKISSALVALEGDHLPAHILDAYLGKLKNRPEDIYLNAVERMKQVVLAEWHTQTLKATADSAANGTPISVPPPETLLTQMWGQAPSDAVRQRLVTGILQLLFPVFRGTEKPIAQRMVFTYLASRTEVQSLARPEFKKWFESKVTAQVEGARLKKGTLADFVTYMVDVHEEIRNAKLPTPEEPPKSAAQ